MAFDQTTRNRLARFVSDTRSLLAEEFTRQLQNDYGLDPNSGEVTDLARLEHLDDARRETARLLRDTMDHYLASADTATPAKAKKARQDVLDRIVREQAFTILNRLCALRMAEARGLLIESIAKGYQSKGFQLYQRLAGTALGETGACYRLFIFSVFDEFAADLPVLFDRFSPQGRLFPREAALLSVLQEINHPDIDPLWAEDETIGWIYQYFNSVEERRQMRADSQAPRNSRELAVRNQFFTPRYVVEFLADNTLGRIWYEMTKGESSLKDSCRYLVRRPTEIFLSEGEAVPEQDDTGEELSQEELLKQPVHILHRPLKDPRDIKMLDPACGSMHFGLYAFDLFEHIYEEAWEIEAQRGADGFARTEELKPLHESYTDKDAFLRDMPRLIIERNIHGIDIDPRAVQIAGLSLWLRAQRSWQVQNVKALDRPQIQRSNIVCAEPMPGETDMLEEFTDQLQPKVLGQLVKIIFEKMKLAGEAGSLLKIEEEIKDAVSTAHGAYRKYLLEQQKDSEYLPGMAPKREATLFDFADLPQVEDFWNRAESQVIAALANYSEHATGSEVSRRRMFAKDAVRGFALIDLSRKSFDVSLMNPPFGEFTAAAKNYAKDTFPSSCNDVFAAFTQRFFDKLCDRGLLGAITSRTGFFITTFRRWREEFLLENTTLECMVDLGLDVMDDAMVEAAAYCLGSPTGKNRSVCIRTLSSVNSDEIIQKSLQAISDGENCNAIFLPQQAQFRLLPQSPFVYWVNRPIIKQLSSHQQLTPEIADVRQGLATADDPRFARAIWEVPAGNLRLQKNGSGDWIPYIKGGSSQPWFAPVTLVVNWKKEAGELWSNLNAKGAVRSNIWMLREAIDKHFFRPGFSWTRRAVRFIPYVTPDGAIPSASRYNAYPVEGCEYAAMGVAASNIASAYLRFYGEMFQRPNYMVEVVKTLPWPDLSDSLQERIAELVKNEVARRQKLYQSIEPYQEFVLPSVLLQSEDAGQLEFDRHALLDSEIEALISEAYGLNASDTEALERDLHEAVDFQHGTSSIEENDEDDEEGSVAETAQERFDSFLSYALGCALGRWDVRYATGMKNPPQQPAPFDPLPRLPLGALKEENYDPENYPIEIAPHGFLCSDEGNPWDLIEKIRGVFDVTLEERSNEIEQQALVTLSVTDLREYFRNSNRFFTQHLRRYTKSRRYSPIYWPLSTPSGSYTLWLYYHRLTDQTLYTCVNDFVDPKLKEVSDDATSLRSKSNRSSAEEKELERLSDLELELKDFRDELLRIARFWKPNLNDGVQITAAPLWNLFQHRQWKARLKDTWEKLEAGDYDWAHLALSVWPDRVVRASHKDRSYAIAHDLDDQLWHEVEVEKVGRGGRVTKTIEWQPRNLSSADLQRIITEVKAR
jgi:hypothetical protein